MIKLYNQKLQYSDLKCCQIIGVHWSVAIKSKLIVGKECLRVYSVVVEVGKVFYIYIYSYVN